MKNIWVATTGPLGGFERIWQIKGIRNQVQEIHMDSRSWIHKLHVDMFHVQSLKPIAYHRLFSTLVLGIHLRLCGHLRHVHIQWVYLIVCQPPANKKEQAKKESITVGYTGAARPRVTPSIATTPTLCEVSPPGGMGRETSIERC